jgi:hypothetical protein
MPTSPISSDFDTKTIARNLLFVFLGVVVFMLRRHYVGPADELVHAYAGNLSVSFALYFLFANFQVPLKHRRLLAAAIVLAVVELFEAFNGFGVMLNTYDPFDFLANAVGIAFAFSLDSSLAAKKTGGLKSQAP